MLSSRRAHVILMKKFNINSAESQSPEGFYSALKFFSSQTCALSLRKATASPTRSVPHANYCPPAPTRSFRDMVPTNAMPSSPVTTGKDSNILKPPSLPLSSLKSSPICNFVSQMYTRGMAQWRVEIGLNLVLHHRRIFLFAYPSIRRLFSAAFYVSCAGTHWKKATGHARFDPILLVSCDVPISFHPQKGVGREHL